jgi:hypothetical protein
LKHLHLVHFFFSKDTIVLLCRVDRLMVVYWSSPGRFAISLCYRFFLRKRQSKQHFWTLASEKSAGRTLKHMSHA